MNNKILLALTLLITIHMSFAAPTLAYTRTLATTNIVKTAKIKKTVLAIGKGIAGMAKGVVGIAALTVSVLLPLVNGGYLHEARWDHPNRGHDLPLELDLPWGLGHASLAPAATLIASIPVTLASSYLGYKALSSALQDLTTSECEEIH